MKMKKIIVSAFLGAIFLATYLISRNSTAIVDWDKMGQVVGLGAVVAGYFGAKAFRKINVSEK